MRRRQFTTLLARPRLISRQINPVHLIAVLSGIAYMLTSPSALPQASQQTQDASGQQAFNNACRTCHMVKDGDNRLGPHLYKVIGRQAGSLPDYNYSSAMKGADFAWDKEKLERFIANPDEVVPGNRMKPYTGLASSDDRAKIVAFLAQSR
jgi:cytochrome c